MKQSMPRAPWTLTVILAGLFCVAAHAQQEIALQSEYYIGEGDVELHKGVFAYANKDIEIGREDQDAALSLTRYFGVHQQTGSYAPFGANTGHSLEISLYRYEYLLEPNQPPNWSYDVYVVIGRALQRIDYTNVPGRNVFGQTGPNDPALAGTTLISSNGGTGPFVYTTEDGTRIEFPAIGGTYCPNIGLTSNTCSQASAIIKPNGERLSFSYETVSSRKRLRTVISTRGYGIGVDYNTSAAQTVSKVCAVNLSVQYMAPGGPCPAGSRAATYAYLPSSFATTALESFSDPSGATTNYSYGSHSNGTDYWTMTGIRNPGSAVNNLTIAYDSNYKVATQTYANGSAWSYAYQALGNWYDYPQNDWTEVTNPIGEMTRHTFSGAAAPKPSTVRDPLNRTQQFQYVSERPEFIFREISPEGNFVEYSYNLRGNRTQTKLVAKSGSGAADRISTSAFQTNCTNRLICNKPEYTIDARGNRTDYIYDPVHGGVLTETLPAPIANGVRPQRRYSYSQHYAWYRNASGTLVQAPSPIWLLSSISECRTQASCGGTEDESLTTFAYGSSGVANNLLRTSQTKKAGDNSVAFTVTWTYDEWGNILTEDGPLAGSVDTKRTRYDAMNRAIGVIGPDPDGAGALLHRAVRTTYDGVGRITKIERGTVNSESDTHWAAFSAIESTEYQRDVVGRVTGTLIKGSGTEYALIHTSYDGAWRLECTARRMDPAQWSSQTNACVPQASGPHGPDRIAKNVYDAAGQVTKLKSALGTADQIDEVSYAYTSNGKRSSLTDAENNTTSFYYDGFDRLYQTRYPVSTQGSQQSSSADFEQVGYDNNDNVTQRRLRDGQIIGYEYDALNRQTLKNLPASESDISTGYDLQGRVTAVVQGVSTVARVYDALGRMQRETTGLGNISYVYDASGQRTRTTWPDGFYVTFDHLITGEVSAVREYGAASGVGVLVSYGYDNLGRKSSITRGNGTSTSFGYDGISRLTSLVHNLAGSSQDVTSSFTYNPASQIRTWSRDNDVYVWTSHYNVNRSYALNGLNQLTQSTSDSGSVMFGHDGRGNLTGYGPSLYTYTVENRLISASNGATFAYDPIGRLSQSSGIGGITRFQYDDADLAGEFSASGQVLRRYIHGSGADEPLVWYEGSGTSDRRWLHHDEHGSIVSLSDQAGASIAINSYDEFGIPAAGNLGRFQYTGQTWLPELAMYYYKARLYSPALGRFLQTDPIGYEDDWNLYAYVRNDPTNKIDPSGMAPPGCGDGKCGDWSWYEVLEGFANDDGGGLGGSATSTEHKVGVLAAIILAGMAEEPGHRRVPNEYGSKGKPDHQRAVDKLAKQAEGEVKPGEQVLRERKIQGHDSNRRPDVQIVDERGKTRKTFEAERKPESARVEKKLEEYESLGIKCQVTDLDGRVCSGGT